MSWTTQNDTGSWGSAPSSSPSPWGGFEEVEARAPRNAYLPAGLDSTATVKELKVVQSQKNLGQSVFVAALEFENQEGERRTYDWVARLNERAYLAAIKSLVCSLNPEADPRSFGQQAMDHICGPDQPCKGMRVKVRTEEIVTSRGNPFTKVYWDIAD